RRVENRVENRALSDFALRVEAPYSEEFNALGMRASNALYTPRSYRSHAPRIQELHALGIQESHALGIQESHAPRIQESHALGSHALGSHASGSHALRAPLTNAFETPLSGALNTERSQVISQRLSNIEQENELLIKIMNRLCSECYYCLCTALENSPNFKVSKEHSWRLCKAQQSDRRLGSVGFETFTKRLVFNKDQC